MFPRVEVYMRTGLRFYRHCLNWGNTLCSVSSQGYLVTNNC